MNDMSLARVHIFVGGRVQGVFFRQNMRNVARGLSLTGWVRNLYDGRVEAVAEGEKEKIERLLLWCHRGPPHAQVSDVEVIFEDYTGEYGTYEIRDL